MAKKKTYTDQEIFIALINRENWAIEHFYKQAYPLALTHITSRGGNKTNAITILDDSFILFLNNIRKADFELTAKMTTYFMGIVKLKWLEHLRKTKKLASVQLVDFQSEQISDEAFVNELLRRKELGELVNRGMNEIGEKCKQVINGRFLEGKSEEVLAKELNLSSIASVKDKRSTCMSKLRALLKKWRNSAE